MLFPIIVTHLLYQVEFIYSNISNKRNDAFYHMYNI